MTIDFDKLAYTFKYKPLLVGGKAMEYYGLRKTGNDIDLIAQRDDIVELTKRFPNKVKDLWGDIGICPLEFEIWKSIRYLHYEDLQDNALEEDTFKVVSLKNLLYMKALFIENEKNYADVLLIKDFINNAAFEQYPMVNDKNSKLLEGINNIQYLEIKSPSKE